MCRRGGSPHVSLIGTPTLSERNYQKKKKETEQLDEEEEVDIDDLLITGTGASQFAPLADSGARSNHSNSARNASTGHKEEYVAGSQGNYIRSIAKEIKALRDFSFPQMKLAEILKKQEEQLMKGVGEVDPNFALSFLVHLFALRQVLRTALAATMLVRSRS